MIRLGIVGAGIIWEHAHRDILGTMGETLVLKAFCARSEAKRMRLRAQFPHADVVDDYHALIAAEIDAVVVLTPIPLNASVAIAGLEANRHVIVEKPVAMNLNEGRALLAAAAHGKRVYVLEQAPYDPAIPVIADILAGGHLGVPIGFERVNCQLLDPVHDLSGGYGGTDWRRNPTYPIGLLFDAGIHDLAVLGTLFGAPERVYARGRSLRPEYGRYDYVQALLGYVGGVCGTYTQSGLVAGHKNYFSVRCSRGIIHYEDGIVSVLPTLPDASPYGKPQQRSAQIALPPDGAYQVMWEHIVDCIQSGREPDYTVRRAVGDLALMEAIGASLESGVAESPTSL